MRPIRDILIEQCTAAGKDAYVDSLRQINQDTSGYVGTISALRLFPIKALGELLVDEVRVTEFGLQSADGYPDRGLMLGIQNDDPAKGSGAQYTRFSQRKLAELNLVKAKLEAGLLKYTATGMPDITLSPGDMIPRKGATVTVEAVPGTVVKAVVENGRITESIRAFIGRFRKDAGKVDVLFPAKNDKRTVEERHRRSQQAKTFFSDGGQILLASASSLAFVQRHINRKPGTPRQIPMSVFRPNIEVSDWPENLEDILTDAVIEGMMDECVEDVLQLFGDLSVRCSVTMVDPVTGKRARDGEPLATFGTVRPLRADGSSKKPTFAVNTVFPQQMQGRIIRLNDTIVSGREKQIY